MLYLYMLLKHSTPIIRWATEHDVRSTKEAQINTNCKSQSPFFSTLATSIASHLNVSASFPRFHLSVKFGDIKENPTHVFVPMHNDNAVQNINVLREVKLQGKVITGTPCNTSREKNAAFDIKCHEVWVSLCINKGEFIYRS